MSKNQYSIKREELIKKLRKNAIWFQVFALIFLIGGLALGIWCRVSENQNIFVNVCAIVILFLGIAFEVSAIIYFNKAKFHLSTQNIQPLNK